MFKCNVCKDMDLLSRGSRFKTTAGCSKSTSLELKKVEKVIESSRGGIAVYLYFSFVLEMAEFGLHDRSRWST